MTWTGRLLAFDVESTGPDPETARIVSFALVMFDGTDATPTYSIVNPGVDIPDEAVDIHGITTAIAQSEGIDPVDAVLQIRAAIEEAWSAGIPVAGHNVSYDLTVLDRESRRHLDQPFTIQGPVLDSLVLDRVTDRRRKGKRTLDAVAAHYGVDLLDAHNAAADAIAAVDILRAIAHHDTRIAGSDLRVLYTVQVRAQRIWAQHITEYWASQGKTETACPDWPLRIAS